MPHDSASTEIAQKLEVIDKWGKSHRDRRTVSAFSWLPLASTGRSSEELPCEPRRMTEPGTQLLGWARFPAPGLFAAVAGAPPVCRRQRGAGRLHLLSRSGAKTREERACRGGLRYLPRQHEKFPHPANIPKPACTTCHTNQAGDYEKGVHGQARKNGNAGAPDCALCHGSAHELLASQIPGLPHRGSRHLRDVPQRGGRTQYRASVHGQALAHGITQAPLCTDCHGEHAILAHQRQLPGLAGHIRDTCGNCHGNVQLSRKFGLPDRPPGDLRCLLPRACRQIRHPDRRQLRELPRRPQYPAVRRRQSHGQREEPGQDLRQVPPGRRHSASPSLRCTWSKAAPSLHALRWTRQFYLLIIPLTIGLMLIHNGGDWVRKLIHLRFRPRDPASPCRDRRVTPRRAHAALRTRAARACWSLSFLTLVWTGFALKYPDQWWARPLLLLEGRYSMRSLIHRVAAVVFIAVSVTHLLSLIVNRSLREHWKEMWPKTADPREALANFSYNVGIGDQPPGRSAHSYIEKAEYWAVVWGAIVMAASGLMLWANNLSHEAAAQDLARHRDFGPLLRGRAGDPRHRGLAFLFDHLRPGRLSDGHRIPDRKDCQEAGINGKRETASTRCGRLIYA